MMLNPQKLSGPWKSGIVFDWHSISYEQRFVRSELGECLYRFKYGHDQSALKPILKSVVDCIGQRARGKFDLIIPVPPSYSSKLVTGQIAGGIAGDLGAGFSDTALLKCRSTQQVKGIKSRDEKIKILANAFQVDQAKLAGKRILLVDDLYQSGATMECATQAIMSANPEAVYILAITRARFH